MNRKTQSLGLMANTNQANDELLKQIQSLFGEDTHDLTVQERIARLSALELQKLKMQLPLLRLHGQIVRKRDPYVSHAALIDQHYKGLSDFDKALYAELLEAISPTPEAPAGYAPKPVKPKRDYTAEYQDDFLKALAQSESSGNSNAEITIKDGRRFVGALQFGQARLEDYMAATGKSFTQDEFKADTALQDEVAKWHVVDIDKAIDALGDAAEGYSRDGLRAVAHLGGKGGMTKWVKTAEGYNPSDELGTSLSDYYKKFSSQ